MTDTPQTFEDLRGYFDAAVQQLTVDLQVQAKAYDLRPTESVLALIDGVAAVQGVPAWHVWESWALRHLLPMLRLVRKGATTELDAAEVAVLRKRLRDALGYCVLAQVLAERD